MMDTTRLERFRTSLLRQKDSLLDWFFNTPADKKHLHLGGAPEQSARAHIQVLDETIRKTEDRTIGVCTVCHEEVEPSRLELDYTACVCIDHYSAEEKRRLELDLELSQKLQRALLPQQIPDMPGLQVAAFSQPATIVGGDYFDFFRFADGAHGIVIADVMGKGMPASMLMASLQASLRLIGPESATPDQVISRLNCLFCHNISLTRFVTLFIARYDPNSASMQYTNAGHNPPLLSRSGSAQWLQPTGAAIGLIEDAKYGLGSIDLRRDDVLVLYTDGLTEAVDSNDEEYGTERLARSVHDLAAMPAAEQLRQLRASVQAFSGKQTFADDLTLLVLKRV